jgi:histone-lysine N-methyltransferase SETD2
MFLREYNGEIINGKDLTVRMESHRLQKHLYIMQLKSGSFLDAMHKGSIGRFINHSCEPNCTVQVKTEN